MKEHMARILRGPIRQYNEHLIRKIYRRELSLEPLSERKRNFVLVPHVDDEVIGLGGWLLQHGKDAVVCYSTDSGGSRSGHDYEKTARLRKVEAEKMAKHLQVKELHFLNLREDEFDEGMESRLKRLKELLQQNKSKRIFTVSPYDHHPLHRKTTRMLCDVVDAIPADCRITFYEGSNLLPLSWVNASVPLNEEQFRKKAELYQYFPSQTGQMDFDIYQRLNRGKGRSTHAYAAEFFRDLSVPEFLSVMDRMKDIELPGYRLGNHRSFRKIRPYLNAIFRI